MFWLAGSVLATAQSGNAAVEALLQRLRPSLALLGESRRPTGAAALVDAARGLFLAHGDAVQGETIQARVNDWRVSLRVLGQDPRTGLVILALRSNPPAGLGPALPVADFEPALGTKVCLVFADGGLLGTFIGGQQFSLTRERVAMPVSEIRFENPQQLVGGALIVTFEGKLLGAMGSTLARPGNASKVTLKALADVQKEFSGRGAFSAGPAYNPGPLTVAYIPTLSLVRRSVGGLLSEGHRVDYAVLGIAVLDAPGGGAVVRLVSAGGPAARSGVQTNDVLLAIGEHPIRNRLDFFQAVLTLRPGEAVKVRLRHDGRERTVEVVPAPAKA